MYAFVRLLKCSCVALILLLELGALPASADCPTACAGISGRVLDPDGRRVANAVVVLESAVPGESRTTAADAIGQFSLKDLRPGTYTLKVTAPDFAPFVQTSLLLHNRETRLVTVQMALATVAETVSVESRQEVYQEALDVNDVRESPARDVGEALARVDGVWKIRKGGIANDVVMRGFQQNNVNVMINGARMHGACPGHMDPPAQHVDFAEVERVDVVKGAFDVRNPGSLGGLVNIISKQPGTALRIRPTFSAGSFSFYNPAITASYGKDKFRLLGGYSYRSSQPYTDGSGRPFTSYVTYSAAGLREKAFDIHTGWFESELTPTEKQRLSLAYTRQEAGLILYPYLAMDSDFDNADRIGLKYQIKDLSSAVRALRVDTYLTQVRHFMSDSQRATAKNNTWTMGSYATSLVAGGRLESDLGRDLTLGFDGYYRNWNVLGYGRSALAVTRTNTLPNVDTQSLGVFADYRHAFTDRIKVSAGLRFDHAAMRVSNLTASTDFYYIYKNTRRTANTDNYPSGNVRLSFALPRTTELFVGVGTTARIPDAEERYFARKNMAGVTVGSPLLPPTRNTEFTAGFNWKHGASYLKPVLFYSRLDDYIVLNNQPRLNTVAGQMVPASARGYENVDARIYGGEISYAAAITGSLSVSGGSSYSRGIRDRKPAAGILGTDLPEMPPLRAWTAVRYVHKIAFAEIGGTAVSRQTHVDRDLQEAPTAGYGTMNFKLGATYKKLYASFMVDNLLNKFYYEHLSYYRDPFRSGVKVPEPGRNFFMQVSYTF